MTTPQNKTTPNGMTAMQRKTLLQFKKNLTQALPNSRIAWALPVENDFIELHLEHDKRTYRKSLKAAKLAIASREETGVTITLR